MYKFGKSSLERLQTCDPRIQEILNEAIKIINISILCGTRTKEEQDEAVSKGLSKTPFPNSKHNSNPSKAVDIIMYPIDWNDSEKFFYMAGIIKAIAHMKNIKIRWGGDWDSDNDFKDQTFNDFVHFELIE